MQNNPIENLSQSGSSTNSNPVDRIRELENQVSLLRARLKQLEDQNQVLKSRGFPDKRETLMNRILDILPVGVWLTNEDGKIINVNIAAQLIWSGAKMVGIEQYHEFKGWWLDTGEPLSAEDWPMVRAVRYGETRLNDEIEIESFDGQRKLVSNSAIPVFSGAQEISGAIVVFEDITLRKQAEVALKQYNLELEQRVRERTSALERSNKDLEDFAFVASHDLQEPLRKVMTFGRMLLGSSRERLDPNERDYIERMYNAAERMSQMLLSLLNYSRLSTRALPPQMVNLNRAVAEVLSDLEMTIHKTGGSVEVNNLPTIEAEPVQMRQLLQNLISNGLKFHKPDVPPLVKVYQVPESEEDPANGGGPDEMVTLVVEDNGIGFEAEHKARLFQPFNRLVGRHEYEGTGIGLSICRKIVESHGGEIDAFGYPGEGAKFIIRLPVQQTSNRNV